MDSNKPGNQQEKSKQIVKNLHLLSDEQVVSFLNELRKSPELDYINPLLNLLLSDKNDLVRKAIVEYLSDIKDQKAVDIVVNFISESFPQKNVAFLVTACWQSRLNFSKHLAIFFRILIKANYLTAFEAFTVIENSIDDLTVNEITNYIAEVKKGIVGSDRDKQLLLLEMVSVLNKAKRESE